MNDNRPVNLDIKTIRFPLAAIASILHRISGVIIFFGLAIALWLLDYSLSDPGNFADLQELFSSPLMKFVVWGLASAMAYHLVAGIKHLVMDAGIGETREGAPVMAVLTLVISAVLIISLGVMIW